MGCSTEGFWKVVNFYILLVGWLLSSVFISISLNTIIIECYRNIFILIIRDSYVYVLLTYENVKISPY